MEIPLRIANNRYSDDTVRAWQSVWSTICEMAYKKQYVTQSIITYPGILKLSNGCEYFDADELEHTSYYERMIPNNAYKISIDYMWRKYSEESPDNLVHVVPEFQTLHVPRVLFDEVGVSAWFDHCFPNCLVTFWQESCD